MNRFIILVEKLNQLKADLLCQEEVKMQDLILIVRELMVRELMVRPKVAKLCSQNSIFLMHILE